MDLIINTSLLRELDERKLIIAYARYMYRTEEDINNDSLITTNLKILLDWDYGGDQGLGLYCSHFESIKRKDWKRLIDLIKKNKDEIINFPRNENDVIFNIKRNLNKYRVNKTIYDEIDYEPRNRRIKAVPVIYKGRPYKSHRECMYKEGITYYALKKYLKDVANENIENLNSEEHSNN